MYYKRSIKSYPLQLYASALLFSLTDSVIRKHFRHEEPKGIIVKPAISSGWSACLQTLKGHSSVVTFVAFSGDSTKLASALNNSTIRLWDVSSSACLRTYTGHSSGVSSLAFSHDSTKLALVLYDKTVRL